MAIDWDKYVVGPTIGVFGEELPVLYAPAGGSATPIQGVFDDAYHDLSQLQDGAPTSTMRPVLGVQASALAAKGIVPAQGDQVTCRGVAYVVADTEPDGHGHIKLMLTQAAK